MKHGVHATPGQREAVLEVARAHSSAVAADWFDWSVRSVIDLRKRVDGYERGRGSPTVEERRRSEPRWNCPCSYCVAARSQEMVRSTHRHTQRTEPEQPITGTLHEPWRALSACFGEDGSKWFPVAPNGEPPTPSKVHMYDDGRAICSQCPVQSECLVFALTNDVPDGLFGGLDPFQRQQVGVILSGRSIAHGTRDGYRHQHCRCDDCTSAWWDYNREHKQRWLARRKAEAAAAEFEHGTIAGYADHFCGCDPCRQAWADYKRDLAESVA